MLDKQESRRRWSELRSLINEWDPVGLIEAGAPSDEYDCITGPLMRMLEQNAPVAELAAFLASHLQEDFGFLPGGFAEFAGRAREWYESRWHGTTSG